MLPFKKQKLLSDHKALGKWGEKQCEKFLKRKSYKTLAKNYACKRGELDLVMADRDGTVVFVEVKTRTTQDFAEAEDAITLPKKQRLARASQYFLKVHKIEDRPCRFDVVTIILGQNGKEIIKHYQNAFIP